MHQDKNNNLHPYHTRHTSLESESSNAPVSIFVWRVFFYCFYWPCSRVFRCSIYLQIVLKLTNRSDLFLLGDSSSLRLNTWHRNRQRCQTAPASLPWLMTLSTFSILKSDLLLSVSSVYHQCVTAVSSLSYLCDTQQMECERVWMFVCACACMTLASVFSLKPCCISK